MRNRDWHFIGISEKSHNQLTSDWNLSFLNSLSGGYISILVFCGSSPLFLQCSYVIWKTQSTRLRWDCMIHCQSLISKHSKITVYLIGLHTCLHGLDWLQRAQTCRDRGLVSLTVSGYAPNFSLCYPRSYQAITFPPQIMALPLDTDNL